MCCGWTLTEFFPVQENRKFVSDMKTDLVFDFEAFFRLSHTFVLGILLKQKDKNEDEEF